MVGARPSIGEIRGWLENIPDPEIPVLSITDLGIVRNVQWTEDRDELIVTITPTYSGCPAMDAIAEDIRVSMKQHGIENFRLETKLSPPWTTDWLSAEAKEKLRTYGIAPPQLISIEETVHCPHCDSDRTRLLSRFGSTPCKALYKCLDCLEPFEAFKRH